MHRVLRSGGTMFCTVPCMNVLRRCGLMALQDWIVCNPTIRRLTGRKQDVEFSEYVYGAAEYGRLLEKAGFEVLRLLPMGLVQHQCQRPAETAVDHLDPQALAVVP